MNENAPLYMIIVALFIISLSTVLFREPKEPINKCIVNITKEHIHIKGSNCNYTFDLPKP